MNNRQPAVWFPAIRCHSGADSFTERLVSALNQLGIRAEITWLPHRAEFAPWSVLVPQPPAWANIVHINSWLPSQFIPPALPVVVTLHFCVHDPTMNPYKSLMQALYHRYCIFPRESANLKRAQRIVAVSHYTAKMTEMAFGIGPVDVIHNGIDTEHFAPSHRASPHHPFRLLYVGNWSTRKGVDLLAPLMKALGEGFELRYTSDRNGQHKRYALPVNCTNIGRLSVEKLISAYHDTDALLFPSRLEGLPLTPLEAMACGLPVIAANTTSLPEVVENGVTGWLCRRDDLEEFVQNCQKLATDPGMWRSMSKSARALAGTSFAESEMVTCYQNIYRSLI